jgi:hypothetical protein
VRSRSACLSLSRAVAAPCLATGSAIATQELSTHVLTTKVRASLVAPVWRPYALSAGAAPETGFTCAGRRPKGAEPATPNVKNKAPLQRGRTAAPKGLPHDTHTPWYYPRRPGKS